MKVWEKDPFNSDDPYVVVSQGMLSAAPFQSPCADSLQA